MTISILMPALSPTMTEGNLARWLKKAGDQVSSGDVIAEIETDKATMEVESIEDGILAKILVAEGTQNVAVNSEIAILLEDGEDQSALESHQSANIIADNTSQAQEVTSQGGQTVSQNTAINNNDSQQDPARIKASPLAKRLANDQGIDLKQISGSGPKGRVIKVDVENFAANTNVEQKPANDHNLDIDVHGMPTNAQVKPISTMRTVIAKRLVESKQTVPHFYLTISVKLDKLLKLRQEINSSLTDGKITVNDFIIKATALALQKNPLVNASWQEQGQGQGVAIHYYDRADVAVAVAIDDGLITPIIRGACAKSLAAISQEIKALAKQAKQNKLRPEQFTGGTVTISNLGMFGVDHFQAIVNPPQACILAIGAGTKQPVVNDDGQIVATTIMNITASVDHRVVDGAVAASYLASLKQALENPLTCLL